MQVGGKKKNKISNESHNLPYATVQRQQPGGIWQQYQSSLSASSAESRASQTNPNLNQPYSSQENTRNQGKSLPGVSEEELDITKAYHTPTIPLGILSFT